MPRFSLRAGLMGRVRDTFNGVFRTRMVPHHPTGQLLVERTQPDRDAIMERTARRRIEDATRPLSWGYWALSIPMEDYQALLLRNPDLASNDRETRNRAWRAFIASPESMPYKVSERA